jgi:Ca2+-binding RTX toxin-like protein
LTANVENGRITAAGAANLTGNSLANVLYAGTGTNELDGSTGTDTVSYAYATAAVTASLAVTTAQATGGSGSDTFIVSTRGVDAVITDFKVGQDKLQFEKLGQPGINGVRIVSEKGNAVIYFADNKVTLTGVQASRIRVSDISFI